MPAQLPGNHPISRIVRSPLGLLLRSRAFEAKKLKLTAAKELPAGRLGAAALAAGADPEAFVRALGLPAWDGLAPGVQRRIRQDLEQVQILDRAHQAAATAWDQAFFGPAPPPMPERVALELARRKAAARLTHAGARFGYLARRVPGFRWHIEPPAVVLGRWKAELDNPAAAFAATDPQPAVAVSHPVAGPAGREYWLRFPSPALGDTVWARVYEPAEMEAAAPTVIMGSGATIAGENDYWWPEEDIFARPLAARGLRCILPTSPWHGRRTPMGWYTGEAYIGRSPVGQLELFNAQTRETAILVEWARSRGSAAVGVGGVSLGAIIAQLAAGWCGYFPEARRPDFAFLGATCDHLDEVILQSQMARDWGVPEQLARAGWTPELLQRLRPLLDPPAQPGLPGERVIALLGAQDGIMSYPLGRQMLERWGVPERNVRVLPWGHFSVLLEPLRQPALLEPLVQLAWGLARG